MNTYVVLLRGINVGGNSAVSMSQLKTALEEAGFENVSTYINSGNVLLDSKLSVKNALKKIQDLLEKTFSLDSTLNKVLILTAAELESVVNGAPKGFGTHPEKYHSDVLFLIEKAVSEAMDQVDINPSVDSVWAGKGALYFQRLSAERTKSRMNKIIGKPIYKFMTIRNWNTTTKLLAMIESRKA